MHEGSGHKQPPVLWKCRGALISFLFWPRYPSLCLELPSAADLVSVFLCSVLNDPHGKCNVQMVERAGARYNHVADTWDSNVPSMLVGVDHAAAAAVGTKLYIAGGW